MNSVITYLRQPSSIQGLSAIGGAFIGVLSGAITWQAGLTAALYGVIAIAIPENKVNKTP